MSKKNSKKNVTAEVLPTEASTNTEVASVAEAAAATMPGAAAKPAKHRPRPEVKYTLIAVPPIGSVCPQESQLVQALQVAANGADAPFELTEPQVFEAVHVAAAEKKLVTKQDPWRIMKYYAPRLRDAGILRIAFDKPQAA